jgi:hypothetical protein
VSLTLLLLLLFGCRDECESLAPQFQLDILSGTGLGSIEVVVDYAGQQRGETINVGDKLDDMETSLVVELDPRPMVDFELDVEVSGYTGVDGGGILVATANDRFSGSPNGCNRFEIDLDSADPFDGGVPDGGPGEVCNPTCAEAECNLSCTPGCGACELDCAGAATECTTTCNIGTCAITCGATGECTTACSGGSACDIACGTAGICTARCNGNAQCRLACESAGECNFAVCAGGEAVCPDGSIVCNRPCS